jgi:hypothetical protein
MPPPWPVQLWEMMERSCRFILPEFVRSKRAGQAVALSHMKLVSDITSANESQVIIMALVEGHLL